MFKAMKLLLQDAPVWATAGSDALVTASPLTSRGRARILIADDNTVIRYGVKQLISQETGLEVVGEALNGEDAVALARSLRPDIVIMDVRMPLMDGIEATSLITEEWPETLVVGFSSSYEHNIKAKMLKAGAVDFLEKGESGTQLVAMLHRLWSERG